MKKKLYLVGAIASDPNYYEKFARSEEFFKAQNYEVFNPARLIDIPEHAAFYEANKHDPEKISEYFLALCFPMLDQCDELFIHCDWMYSDGSMKEIIRGQKAKKIMTFQKKIIILTGKKRAGKDTFCFYSGFRNMKLALPIKDIANIFFGKEITDDQKEIVDLEIGISPREFMQKFGNEFSKDLTSDNIWLDNLVRRLRTTQDSHICVTDCRFQFEADGIIRFAKENNCNYRVVKIVRDTGLEDSHITEICDVSADITIENNGSLEEFQLKVTEALK